MKIVELFEAGKRLASQGIEVSRVNKDDFLTAKAALDPLLKKAGIVGGWTSGGAGSFDPDHPYGGGGREDSGDIDIMIDPQNLTKQFPPDIEAYNAASAKPIGPKAMANVLADPAKKAKVELSSSKWALADYMSRNGFRTDPGTLTVEYSAGNKTFSIDLIVRPKESWELHTHDFAKDTTMRGGDLWTEMYPVLAKLASQKTFIDPKTGEEKGNLQFSPDRGLVDRDTNKVIAINKDDIAKILLNPQATARDLASMSGIRAALAKSPNKLAQLPQAQQQ
jgi:hypothetical protein